MDSGRIAADLLIRDCIIVTMDAERRILRDGAIAIRSDRIVAIGDTAALDVEIDAVETLDGRRFVATPGLINAHIHITGEPLTKGFVPEGLGHHDAIGKWSIPLYTAHTPQEERVSAQLSALEMLRTGTTSFVEAGSIKYLDEVVDGLEEIGIRARVGGWTWDRSNAPGRAAVRTHDAVAKLESQMDRFPCDGRRVAAWPNLVGHSSCTDDLWRAAKALADDRGAGLSFHMSPVAEDPAWFLEQFRHRPFEHLAEIGVLDTNVAITHAIHVDAAEIALIAQTGTNIVHCPTTALKLGYGATIHGTMPEMAAAGVNLCLGTDGANSANYSDLMRAAYLAAGLFKDARQDTRLFPASEVFSMATLNGARLLGMSGQTGVLQVGAKADLVLHDTQRPEWRPLLNVMSQLVWSADGRSVHSVWVDGVRVVSDYRATQIDEERLYADAQRSGESIVARALTPGLSSTKDRTQSSPS